MYRTVKLPRRHMGEWRYSSTILNLGDRWGERSASRLGRFISEERTTGTNFIGGWVGPRTGLEAVEKTEILSLTGIEPRLSIPSLYRLSNPNTMYIVPRRACVLSIIWNTPNCWKYRIVQSRRVVFLIYYFAFRPHSLCIPARAAQSVYTCTCCSLCIPARAAQSVYTCTCCTVCVYLHVLHSLWWRKANSRVASILLTYPP
jgi:hypothetical protein